MKQFFKELGIEQTRGFVRFTNSFDGLTEQEKKEAILSGIKANPSTELTKPQIWLYLNQFLKDKESIDGSKKVAVMGCNEATEANRNDAISILSKEIIKSHKKEGDIMKGLRLRNIFNFLK